MAAKKTKQKTRYRPVCTVSGCDWVGENVKSERAAGRSFSTHAIAKHLAVKAVKGTEKTVFTEVAEG
jgi:hypothetical protein